MKAAHICIFSKPAVPGAVKTRLIPMVGARTAAKLAEAFFLDTWSAVQQITWAKPVIASTDPQAVANIGRDADVWPQGEGDLGDRIERILRRALARAPLAIALGADTPGLPPRLIEKARIMLVGLADAVLGPSADGGFYLLGMRKCPPGILAGLPWSREHTFVSTLSRLRNAGLKVRVLEPWFDVDRPEDLLKLARLLTDGMVAAPRTASVLRKLPVAASHSKPAVVHETISHYSSS